MTVTEKANSAASFLAMVPPMLGYVPTESLVAIPFLGTRSLGTMRVDMPDGDQAEAGNVLAGMLCRIPQADAVAAVVYTQDLDRGLELLRAVDNVFTVVGFRIVDLAVITADHYYTVGDEFTAHPVDEVATPAHLRHHVRTGDQSTPPVYEPVPNVRYRNLSVSQVIDLPEINERLLSVSEWDSHTASLLASIVATPATRDVLIVQTVLGSIAGAEALAAQLDWEDGADYPEHLANVMKGNAPQPNPARLDALIAGCGVVAASTEGSVKAGALAAGSWATWALGRSSIAESLAKQALEVQPGHGLSEIMLAFINAALLPEWAFTR